MNLLGLDQITAEFEELGVWMTGLTLAMGNLVFFLLDRLLERKPKRKH